MSKENIQYIELMSRNMMEHLIEAIHDYVSIHNIDHERVDAIVLPVVISKFTECKEGRSAKAHLLAMASMPIDTTIETLKRAIDKLEKRDGVVVSPFGSTQQPQTGN